MVITKLVGGLGNQLFQYAAGLSLAQRLKKELIVDATAFSIYKLHSYSLGAFRITEKVIFDEEARKFRKRLRPQNSRFLFPWEIRKFNESDFSYNEEFSQLTGNVFLEGYWQSERYFATVRETLRARFVLRESLSEKDRQIEEEIHTSNCTALHIRRADYVSNTKTNSVHGTSSLSYYQKALEILKNKKKIDKIFVFSDDHIWAKEHLKSDLEMVFVEHNTASRNFADLHLMSLCRHQITANSSFSWWGAWLNQSPEKLIIMPEPWFSVEGFDTKDLYIPGAQRISGESELKDGDTQVSLENL